MEQSGRSASSRKHEKRIREKRQYERFIIMSIAAIMIAVPVVIIAAVRMNREGKQSTSAQSETETAGSAESAETGAAADTGAVPDETTASPETEETEKTAELPDKRTSLLSNYTNLGVVTADSFLNVRESPADDAEVVGKIWKNAGADILSDTGTGWYQISSGDITGYVSSSYMATGEDAVELGVENCYLMAKVNTTCLNVRSQPTMDSEAWTQLNGNELQVVLSVQGDWLEVSINETTGYISADYVELGYYLNSAVSWNPLDDTTELRRNLVEYGMQFLGTPYKFGGTDLTAGIDCSGFTQAVFGQFGYELYRESYNQRYLGVAVASVNDAQPGDLMFYTDSSGTVDHVAIYIGSNRILHACESHGGIVITAYNYNTEPAYIRNILGDN